MIRSSFLISSIALAAAWLACAQTVLAQPVLTASDLPQGGQTYLRATAVPPLFSDGLEDSGAGLTWDFSDLASTGDQETEYFPMSEAGFTTQFIFSSADHFTAFELPDLGLETGIPISGATVYQEFGGSAYKTIGLGITTDFIDLPVIYEDEEELLPLPLTFGATLEGSSAFEVELPELLYYSTSQTAEIEVDAWGTPKPEAVNPLKLLKKSGQRPVFNAGEKLVIRYYFKVLRRITSSQKIFLHVDTPGNRISVLTRTSRDSFCRL